MILRSQRRTSLLSSARGPRRVLPVALLAAASLVACGGSDDASSASGTSNSVEASSIGRRLEDPKAANVRELIDRGRPDLARSVIDSFDADLVARLGVEDPLLRARLSFLEGNEAVWLGLIEEARALDPKDPRPYATAAEIYAAMGRHEAAKAELERGAAMAGSITPELQRAQGVLSIVLPGGAKTGLQYLQAAYRADDGLPFIARPLGQAFYLMAQVAAAEDQGELAVERLESSLGFDPQDADARLLYAKLLISVRKDVVQGLDLMEQLYAEGEPIQADLGRHHWRAGLIAQLQGEREAARKYYLRSKELGCPDVESGTARDFLREEAKSSIQVAMRAAEVGDQDGVRAAVAGVTALRAEPEEVVRRELALRFIGEADTALAAGGLDEATGLVAAALYADRGAAGIAEVQSALFEAKAIAALEAGEVQQALRFVQEATVVRPDSVIAWHMLGELEYELGHYPEASKALLKAMSFARASGEPLGLDVAQKLAESQHLSENAPAAVATLEQALRDAGPEDLSLRDEIERYLQILKD